MNMTQNVKTNSIDYNLIKDKDFKQITDYAKKHPLKFKMDDNEMQKFAEFAKAPPGSDVRKNILNPPVEQKQEPVQGNVQDVSAKPVEEAKKQEPVKETPKNPELQDLLNKLAKATDEAQKHRQGASRVGNELDKTRKEKEELEKQKQELEQQLAAFKQNKNQENILTEPVEPDIEKYAEDGGVLSDEYQKDLLKYNRDLKAYFQNQIKSIKEQSLAEINNALSDIKAQASKTMDAANEYRTDKQSISQKVAWDNMWNKAREIQEKVGLKTSVDPETINKMALIVNDPTKYTTEEVNAAADAIKAIDKDSMDNFNALSSIINSMYEVGDYPKRKPVTVDPDDDLELAIALKKAGINKPIVKTTTARETIVNRAESEQKTEGYVRAMPGSEIGANDTNISNQTTNAEDKQKYMAMYQQSRKNTGLLRDKNFVTELRRLQDKLGLR